VKAVDVWQKLPCIRPDEGCNNYTATQGACGSAKKPVETRVNVFGRVLNLSEWQFFVSSPGRRRGWSMRWIMNAFSMCWEPLFTTAYVPKSD
jgi:hypothetical protein